MKKGIRCVHRMLKARLTLAAQPSNYTRLEDHFALLSSWTPHMFVSRADIICAAYIAYFKRRVRARLEIMKLAKNNSLRNLVDPSCCVSNRFKRYNVSPSFNNTNC